MLQRILVPLDGSDRAERAMKVAVRLARGSGCRILALRVVGLPPFRLAPYGEPAQIALAVIGVARDEADDYLKHLALRPAFNDVQIETRVIEGHVSEEILDVARDEQCDMIVICTHGYSGLNRWRLGRVAAHVARHAPVPVLIVPSHDQLGSNRGAGDSARLLITLDGSELAEAAIAPGLDVVRALAAPDHITVHLLEVVDFFAAMIANTSDRDSPPLSLSGAEEQALQAARDYLETVAQRIHKEHPGVAVTTTAMLASDIADTIITVAEEGPGYDFIAMATHGRGGLQRWALGSIAERVLHATRLPLIIARSADAVAHDRQVAEARADAELDR
ncbi:MAG TPA: universal stress protein [Ktedonobacterales bacterium]|jgi:nucleotide-binding universal stress UspA family protein